jgi:hypothetical protein
MTSEKQAESNRRNSEKSTGPRTPEGKKRVAKNAVTDGFTTSDRFIRDEDPAGFNARLERFTEDWKPQGETERFLVERLAYTSCRIDRTVRAYAAALAATLNEAVGDLRELHERNKDALRQDLLELQRSVNGFHRQVREEEAGLSAEQLHEFHQRTTLRRIWRNPVGVKHLRTTVDQAAEEIVRTHIVSRHMEQKIKQLFALEKPTLLQRVNDAISAPDASAKDVVSLSSPAEVAVLRVLQEERECLTAKLEAMEARIKENEDSIRAAIHLPSEDRAQAIHRAETEAIRGFHRTVELLMLLQKTGPIR